MGPNKRLSLFLLLTLTWTYFRSTEGYGTGAPSSITICQGMLPGHGAEPQTSASPYTISIDNVKPLGGDTVKIVLSAPAGQYFKGIKSPQNKGLKIG